jgi:DNA invertase Pin-like site-specific DNA recombinase
MKATRCAIYCRVSTDAQNTENQKRDLLRYCESRGWEIFETFEDVGISGAKDDRPGLNALMKAAKQRQFTSVVVWKFDRFARSTQHLLRALEEFRALGIDFVSCSEGIDTSTPMGKMIFTFLGAIAEFERSLIQERVKAGIARAQEDGVHCGRPRVGFDVNTAIELKRQGLSWKKLSTRMGVSISTLRRVLTPLMSTT